MDRGRKAQPCANKHLRDVETRTQHQAHMQRIRNMRPSIDNKPPNTRAQSNTKRLVVLEERYARIERDNRLLLGRMSEILVKPGGPHSYAQGARHSFASRGEAPPPAYDADGRPLRRSRSLRGDGKRKEAARIITRDNLALLGRLAAVRPVVLGRSAWARDASENARRVEALCEYKHHGGRVGGGSNGGGVASSAGQPAAPAVAAAMDAATTTTSSARLGSGALQLGGAVDQLPSLADSGAGSLYDGIAAGAARGRSLLPSAEAAALAGRGGSLDRGLQALQAITAGLPGFGSVTAGASGGSASGSLLPAPSSYPLLPHSFGGGGAGASPFPSFALGAGMLSPAPGQLTGLTASFSALGGRGGGSATTTTPVVVSRVAFGGGALSPPPPAAGGAGGSAFSAWDPAGASARLQAAAAAAAAAVAAAASPGGASGAAVPSFAAARLGGSFPAAAYASALASSAGTAP